MLFLKLDDSKDQAKLVSLKGIIDAHVGGTDVVLVLGTDTDRQIIKLPQGIQLDESVTGQITELLGASNVRLS